MGLETECVILGGSPTWRDSVQWHTGHPISTTYSHTLPDFVNIAISQGLFSQKTQGRQIGRNVVKKKSVAAVGTIIKAHYCEWWLYTDIFSCSQYPPHADNPVLSVLRTAWTRLSINLVNVAEFWLEVDMAETDVPEIELIIKASTIDGRRKGACIFCQVDTTLSQTIF